MKSKIISLFFLAFGFWAASQVPISLENAYTQALTNNLDLQTGLLKADYQNQLRNAYRTIDPLNISAEMGQINSSYIDNRLSISQSLRLPKFYSAQKSVYEEEWKGALLNLDVQKWQVQREMALIYNNLNYLDEKEQLLKKADSVYSKYFQRAELRLKSGESNILEKTTAENYRSQAKIQLKNVQTDREIALAQFNFLINGSQTYVNERGSFYALPFSHDTPNFPADSWLLKQAEQQKAIEKAKLEAEKVKLLPTFSVGINSGTMRGTGADDKYYDGLHRFQSGMVGLSLPVFNNAQKATIEAQKINQQIAERSYELAKRSLQSQFAQRRGEYEKLKSEVEYYRSAGLQNAEKIMFTADLLLREGEMNYLEYSILINQSLEIRNKYLDAQKQLNDRIIELNFWQSSASTLKN